jgi:hypothetical protein
MRERRRFDYLTVAREKARAGGLPFARQVYEMTVLMLLRGIGPRYYHLARFWRPGIPLRTKLAHYSDGRYRREIARLNPAAYQKCSQHKVVEKAVLALFGLPTPRFLGFYHVLRGRTAASGLLRGSHDLEVLLRERTGQIVCFKAVEGFGGGGFSAMRVERSGDSTRLVHPLSGQISSLEDWSRHLDRSPDGWLLEEYLEQHEAIRALNPDSLNTIRMWTLQRGGDFRVGGAFLRVGRAGSQVDNTSAGGLACPIDIDSGRIASALDLSLSRNEYRDHPDTGARLVGTVIPHWPECLRLAGAALSVFPHMTFAGLDVAIGPEGPYVIELNVYPDKQGAAHIDLTHTEFFRAGQSGQSR